MLVNPAFPGDLEHGREIHLEGTSNTRDIGGYQTSDGRTLRWGQIIRSENLSRLTASDFQKLEEMGLKTVIDLRTDREHKQSPTVWLGDNPPRFFHFPVGDAHNDWFNAQRKLMKRNRFTEAKSLEHMVEGYRMIAEVGPPSYQKLMDVVLDQSNWPVLIHCNAGKERNTSGRGPSAKAWFPIVGVQAEMLEAFYASVDEQYGSIDAFLTEIGVDQDARNALAASLTREQLKLAMGE